MSGFIFLIAYNFHIKFSFKKNKKVGIAIYLDNKENIEDVGQKIFELVGETHGNRAQFSLRYGLSTNNLHCAVLGLASLDHLQNSIQAVEMGPLPEDVLDEILKLQKTNFI